jgi:hypothetical protein
MSASLGQLETREIRAGQVRQRHTDYETVRPMETTTRTRVLQEPREVNSLYVM